MHRQTMKNRIPVNCGNNEPKPLGAGSEKYGLCELCGKNVDSMYIKNVYFGGYLFGHYDCLNNVK